MTIKVKFHLDSQKIDGKQRASNFSGKTVKPRKKPMFLEKKKNTQKTLHNGISQPTDLPVYSKTKNLFKAEIFIEYNIPL